MKMSILKQYSRAYVDNFHSYQAQASIRQSSGYLAKYQPLYNKVFCYNPSTAAQMGNTNTH